MMRLYVYGRWMRQRQRLTSNLTAIHFGADWLKQKQRSPKPFTQCLRQRALLESLRRFHRLSSGLRLPITRPQN